MPGMPALLMAGTGLARGLTALLTQNDPRDQDTSHASSRITSCINDMGHMAVIRDIIMEQAQEHQKKATDINQKTLETECATKTE